MAQGGGSPLATTIGGHGLKNLRFTQFLTPGVLNGEEPGSAQELSRYNNIRSKWTRELLEYRDELERRDAAKAAHAALEQSLQRTAAKRLRQKQRALEVPLVEAPAGMRPPGGGEAPLAPGAGHGTPTDGAGPPGRPRPSLPRERSPSPGPCPISAGPPTKLLAELYPREAQRYQQLLATASLAEVEGRLARAVELEEGRTAEAQQRAAARLARIDHSRATAQARQAERARALQADWAKRYGGCLDRRTRQEQQAQDRQLADIERYRSDAEVEAEAKRRAELDASSRVVERLGRVQDRRQALEATQEARDAERLRQKDARLAASEGRRERDRELHQRWLLGLKADWEDTCVTAQRRREEAVQQIKEGVRLYAERVHGGDHDEPEEGPKKNEEFLHRIPRVLEAAEELRRAKQEQHAADLRAKERQLEGRLQELQEERQAHAQDKQRQEEGRTAMAAFLRETQGEQLRQRYAVEVADALAEAERRRAGLLQGRVEDIRAKHKDFRRLEVREADVRAAEELQLRMQEREAKRLEALQEAEREAEREAEEARKNGRRTQREKFEAVMVRHTANERRRVKHEEDAYRQKVQQIEAFRQKKEQEAAGKPARLPAKDNATLRRTLDYLDLMETQLAQKQRQLAAKEAGLAEHHRRREAHFRAVAHHAGAVQFPQPEEPDLAREALEKRLAYAAEVQEREARLQAAREEAAKKREEALAEVLKRREGNAERHGELRDARMARLTEAEREEERRLQAFEQKKQHEAQDRARLASSLTQQRQARQQLSVTQELDREAAIEAEVEWRHSPRKRAAGWFHGPLGPLASPSATLP
eukprot:EG_transcript_3114